MIRILHIAPAADVVAQIPNQPVLEVRLGGDTPSVQGLPAALPLKSQSCDVVVAHHLDAVPEPERRFAIREVYRVLRLGGTADVAGAWEDGAPWATLARQEGHVVATR